MTPEEIKAALQKLQNDLTQITNATERKNISEAVDERIAQWEKRRAAFILVVLAIFGVASYVSLNDKITDYFAKSVTLKIDDEVKRKTALISIQDPSIAEIKTQLNDISKSVSEISENNKANKTSVVVTIPPNTILQTANKGYAFFGIKMPSGQWSERYFEIKNASDRPPQQGDIIIATGSVNLRKGYILYTSAGWVNADSIGVARRGDVFQVDEVKEVVEGFWWVSVIKK